MSNMSYCRFENTLQDLRDCRDALNDLDRGDEEGLSEYEARAAEAMIKLCKEIVARHDGRNFGAEAV